MVAFFLQLIPKESKCHRRTSFDESKTSMNIPTERDSSSDDINEHKINNTESDEKFYENISTYSTKEGITSSKLCASPPVEKKDANEMGKPRSMSDGIIKSKQDIQLAQMDTKVVKGDCCQSKDDSRSELLKSILNMLPTELTAKKPNAVHPAAPNTNSEDSGISIDNSIAPPSQKTEIECPSEDQSGDLSEITRNMASSVLSLKLLFGGSSTQSSPSTNKDCLPSPKPGSQTRPQSLTSSSSSVGFDNLGYVPVDILSRRSSIFSDASC